MPNQRQPRQVQYNAPEAQSSSFIEVGVNTIARGLGVLENEFASWADNVYDSTYSGLNALGIQLLVPTHPFNPRCIFDVSHHNSAAEPFNFAAARAAGQLAVIIKATDGSGTDKWYAKHHRAALIAELLVGSYHFGRNEDGANQADLFLSVHQSGITVLDVESPSDEKPPHPMTVDQAEAFVKRVYEHTSHYPGIYAGIEHLTRLAASELITKNCWVWLAGYTKQPKLGNAWLSKGENWTIWQYTDAPNALGHTTALAADGKPYRLDLNEFNGTEEELLSFWQSNTV